MIYQAYCFCPYNHPPLLPSNPLTKHVFYYPALSINPDRICVLLPDNSANCMGVDTLEISSNYNIPLSLFNSHFLDFHILFKVHFNKVPSVDHDTSVHQILLWYSWPFLSFYCWQTPQELDRRLPVPVSGLPVPVSDPL